MPNPLLTAYGMSHFEIACRVCDRRGRYDTGRLIRRYGDIEIVELLRIVSSDCPRAGQRDRNSVALCQPYVSNIPRERIWAAISPP